MKQDAAQQRPVLEKVLQDGQAALHGTSNGAGRDELEARLNDSKKRWEEVKQGTEQRSSDLDDLYPKSRAFYDTSVTFSCWLMKAETVRDDLMGVGLTADRDILAQRSHDIQVRGIILLVATLVFLHLATEGKC